MTSPPIFPALAGQGWSVHKKPTFATTVASHVSAREVRSSNYLNPIWQFELSFDGLDGTAGGQYGGLGASSLQSLMGLYLQCQGQFGAFLYYDPTDYSVTAQAFGVGDGATRSFPLVRTLGGFLEPVTQPFAPSAPALFQVQGSPAGYAPNNLLNYSGDATNAAWTKINATITSGAADPFGGAGAQTVTVSATNGQFSQSATGVAGGNYVSSMWLRRNSGSGAVWLRNPAGSLGLITITSSWQRYSIAGPPDVNNHASSKLILGTAGDAVDFYGPQLELSLGSTPSSYFQALATDYYGGPWITANGALVDPSAYSLTNGLVTFSSAPVNGATLAWTGFFGFLCRFDGDDLDFEQFMANLWRAESVKFRSLRAQ